MNAVHCPCLALPHHPIQSLGSEALDNSPWPFYDRPEPIRARSEGEKTWSASLDDIAAGETVCQRLVDGDGDFVFSVELLLSALEMSGIDNARSARPLTPSSSLPVGLVGYYFHSLPCLPSPPYAQD